MKRKHDFFIGIDSDGTAFDSMTYKHTYAFIPVMIEVFGLEKISSEVYEIAEKINLYSMDRGVNRFPGLAMTFDKLKERCGESFPVKDFSALWHFVNSGMPMSNDGLCRFYETCQEDILRKVIDWSKKSDVVFADKVKDLKPFSELGATLDHMHKSADIMVVSAASSKGLVTDWTNGGVYDKVDFVAGQEHGSKSEQLKFALSLGYEKSNCLMLGDSPMDYNAAKTSGIMFYPIVPKCENECIKLLREKYFALFLKGEYTEEIEQELYSKFIAVLGGNQ